MEDEISIKMTVPFLNMTGQFDVISLGNNLYRLRSNDPFDEKLCYGTEIEVESQLNNDGAFQFKGIHKESNFELQVLTLNSEVVESEFSQVGDIIIQNGGYWEALFGGVVYVNLPKDSNLDVIVELNKLISANRQKDT